MQAIPAGTTPTDFDAFVQAQSLAAQQGAVTTAFLVNPINALTFRQIKEATGSQKALLQPDPSQPGRSTVSGVPLVESPDMPAGTTWVVATCWSPAPTGTTAPSSNRSSTRCRPSAAAAAAIRGDGR